MRTNRSHNHLVSQSTMLARCAVAGRAMRAPALRSPLLCRPLRALSTKGDLQASEQSTDVVTEPLTNAKGEVSRPRAFPANLLVGASPHASPDRVRW